MADPYNTVKVELYRDGELVVADVEIGVGLKRMAKEVGADTICLNFGGENYINIDVETFKAEGELEGCGIN